MNRILNNFDNVEKIESIDDTLEALKVVGKLIAEMFGSRCEVAISEIDDNQSKVIWIVNGNVTNREVGSSINRDSKQRLLDLEKGFHLNYSKVSTDKNRELKASTVLFNIMDKTYSFCINYDIELTKKFFWSMQSFLSMQYDQIDLEELPADPNVAIIESAVNAQLMKFNKPPTDLTRDERISIVHELYHLGLFERQKSVPTLAKILDVSRYTIYNDIKAIKADHDNLI